MTERCEDLDPFFDRELGEEAAQAFRDHLASCARCEKILLGRMLEAAVVAGGDVKQPSAGQLPAPAVETATASEPVAPAAGSRATDPGASPDISPGASPGASPDTSPDASPGTSPDTSIDRCRMRDRWRSIAAVAASLAAAIALVAPFLPLLRGPASEPTRAPMALHLAPERGVEVRFSAPALDQHRPRSVMRAVGDASTEQITLRELEALEARGELHALVGAHALNGNLVSAERTANRLPEDAQGLTDRAALALLRASFPADRPDQPTQQAGVERALSLTTAALRKTPDFVQARWNQAIALEHLGLSLVAARAFEGVARGRDDGWAAEAGKNAARLRDDARRREDDWTRVKGDAERMVLGGSVPGEQDAKAAPSLLRDKFYLALATASTIERIDALAPLARALDDQFATAVLSDLLTRVRRSDLRSRRPLAAELAALIERRAPVKAIEELRARALQRGLRDIALASFLAVDAAATGGDHLAILDRLVTDERDPWWKLVALERRAFLAAFIRRDLPAVDAAQRLAAPLCKAVASTWCRRILLFAGGANIQMGRADLAIEQLATARRQAREAGAWNDEVAILHGIGQVVSNRVADKIDTAAVADAYLEEVALRKRTCATRLERFDTVANAELQHHRFGDAVRTLHEGDELRQRECQGEDLELIGETPRLRLVLRRLERLATLRANLAKLRAETQPNDRSLYLDVLEAAANLVDAPARGEAALRQVIDAASAHRDQPFASEARVLAFSALIESVAGRDDARAVLALLGEQLGAPDRARCTLGIASWNRLVMAVAGADGAITVENRDISEGLIMIPPPEAVSRTLRARLQGCARVEVLTSGPYFGAPGLLDDVAWVYHTRAPRTARGPAPGPASGRELVVTDVAVPEELHLPPLRSFRGRTDAIVLSGPRATPGNVLAEMKVASLAIIVAHGLTDAAEPTAASLVLSPDARGDYLLTASKVSSVELAASPIVILAGCEAGRVQVSAEPWSLATSLIAAGARVVIAPTEPIPDKDASDVFGSLVDRIRAGTDPADALVAERRARDARAAWLSSVVVFE